MVISPRTPLYIHTLVKIDGDLTVASERASSCRTVIERWGRGTFVRCADAMAATHVSLSCLCAALCIRLAACQFGFYPRREVRRFNTFENIQDLLQNPRTTLEAILQFGTNRGNQRRPGIINDQYGPPYSQNINFNPDRYYYDNIAYPNRDYNNGRDIVFEPTTKQPFNNNFNPNNNPDRVFTTERSNREIPINAMDNDNFFNNGNYIPDAATSEPGEVNFNAPNTDSGSGNNIPNVPPPSFVGGDGIPNAPPPEYDDRNSGIPDATPPGLGDKRLDNTEAPAAGETSTTLPPLTPVPPSETEDNARTPGLFCNVQLFIITLFTFRL